MKMIPLTRGKFAKVDDRDFSRVSKFKWHLLTAPRSKAVYAARHEPGNHARLILLHREILGEPNGKVDHKNHDGLDCRRKNLREATNRQSAINVGLRADNSSGFKGVHWRRDNKRWRAMISVGGKFIRLGHFSSAKEAALAYDRAAKKYHGVFAWLNFP